MPAAVQQMHIVEWDRLAHRADLMAVASQIADDERRFRLPKALHDAHASRLFKLAEDLRIERFTGDRRMLNRRKIKSGQVLLDQHAVHRGRRTECRDLILRKHRQNFFCIKAVEIINKHSRLTQPLTVELSPEALGPAGVGDGQVQPVRVDLMPVFCSDKMSKRIFIVVCCNFRVSGRTGGKEHEHWLVAAGRVVPARIAAGKQAVFRIEIVPAVPAAANHDLCQLHPGVGLCNVDMVRSIAVCRAENCTDARCLEAVREIMLHKLIGSRNRNGADLVQTQNGKPELVMPLEHEHHAVAASDAERGKVIGGLAGSIFHVLECEPPLRSIQSHMQHGELFRLFTAQRIHNVKCEIEGLLIFESDGLQFPVCILGRIDEAGVNARLRIRTLRRLDHGSAVAAGLREARLLWAEHDRIEQAILSVRSNHAVRNGAVIVDAVAFMQKLGMSADLNFHTAANDKITFLPDVAGQLNVRIECFIRVFVFNEQRVCNAVLKARGHVVIDHLMGLLDLLSITRACQRIGSKLWAAALDEICNVNAKSQRAAVEKSEVEVALPGLTAKIFFFARACFQRHRLRRKAGDLAQLSDASRHFLNFEVQPCECFFHGVTSVDAKKPVSKK